MTWSSAMPEAWCRPSIFCVITTPTLPRLTSSATARWPRLGRASRNASSIAKRRRQVSRRASSEARKSEKSIGAIRVQMPPGLRKSGIPDSVLMPAPVKTTARRERSIARARSAIWSSNGIGQVSQMCRDAPSPPCNADGVSARAAYLAAEGFAEELQHELRAVELRHGRLLIATGPPRAAAWAANLWRNPQEIPITSISDAAAKLRGIQRNWAVYAPRRYRRATLIQEQLPKVSAGPLVFGTRPPSAPRFVDLARRRHNARRAALHEPVREWRSPLCRGPHGAAEPHLFEVVGSADADRPPARRRAPARERLCGRPARARSGRLAVFRHSVLPAAAIGAHRALARRRNLPPFRVHAQVPGCDRPRDRPPLCRHFGLAAPPPVPQQARVDVDQNRVACAKSRDCFASLAMTDPCLSLRGAQRRSNLGALSGGSIMDLGLRGRKALVTGASKGIGRACAEVLAAAGCDVVLVARTEADLEAARAAIVAKHNVAVRFYPLDLSDSRNVDKLAAECADTEILINNAGAIPGGNLDAIDEARWREAWDLKVFGYINMTRRFYALMRKRRKGVIVNVIGAAGENSDFDYVAGSSGNASLMAFTRAMGGAAPRDGLRVVGINPGPVLTDRLMTLMRTRAQTQLGDAERWTEYMKPLAFGRAAKPEEIGWMAAFLASDLSAYTTGTIITIDAGSSSPRSAL